VRRVLIIRLETLGESLLVFPAAKALKQMVPGVRVEVLTRAVTLWKMCPFVDEVLPFHYMGSLAAALLNFRSYDVVIDTEPFGDYSAVLARLLGRSTVGFRTGGRERLYDQAATFNDRQYEAQTFLDLLQPICGPVMFESLVQPRAVLLREEQSRVDQLLADGIVKIAVNLGSSFGSPQRQWPLTRFAELLSAIARKHRCQFVFVGLKLEHELVRQLRPMIAGVEFHDWTASLSVQQLTYLLERMDGLISADTGTMHLGAAVGIPVFSLFGPNLPIRFAPRNRGSVFFYHPTASSPCINVHLPWPKTPCQCDGECVRSIGVEEVFTAIDKALVQNAAMRSVG